MTAGARRWLAILAVAWAPAAAAGEPQVAAWHGQDFLIVPHCGRTGGGVAVARRDGTIFYCPHRVAVVERRAPGASQFFFVHEMGHVVLASGDEAAVDCWAAEQFTAIDGGGATLKAAIGFIRRFSRPDPAYGDGAARADRLERCYRNALPGVP